tara:strand:+ start:873 stop:1058 length:186 start_codon:yes stop_codon:yes gene_type:complete
MPGKHYKKRGFTMMYGKNKVAFPFKTGEEKEEGRQHKVTYDAESKEFQDLEKKRKELLGLT